MRAALTICIGLPGSGKTTWARRQLNQVAEVGARGHLWRVNRDDYRRMLLDGDYRQFDRAIEDTITVTQYQAISLLLAQGHVVICDDTNLHPDYLSNLIEVGLAAGAVLIAQDFTAVPLEECIAQDAQRFGRGGFVGPAVIHDMHDRYIAPHAGCSVHPCVDLVCSHGGSFAKVTTS